jgi:subtilisin-like proprotein convertase family protein
MKFAPLLTLATALSAPGAVFTFDFTGMNTPIPDNNPSGISDQRSVLDTGIISSVKLTLGVNDGSNGDLYVYLVHNDRISIILNRPGKSESLPGGYNDPGLNITFADGAEAGDIHVYRQTIFGSDEVALGGPLTSDIAGPWAPDGRAVSPLSVTTSSPRNAMLGVFSGQELSGEWTIFVADMASGSAGTFTGWKLEITTVPEPAETVLFTGIGLIGVVLLKRKSTRSP